MQYFDSTKMSADEFNFIRLYCNTVKKDYALIEHVKTLTDPNNIGLTNIIDASLAAKKLHNLQSEYCAKIEACGVVNPRLEKKYSDSVTYTQIAHVFTQSFFKLVDSKTKHALLVSKNTPEHDGWSSGHPSQWQQVITSLNDIYVKKNTGKLSTGYSGLINTLIELFNILPKYVKNDESYYNFYGVKESNWEEYDDSWDEYDDEDDESNY
jgi:hypothetical protein